MNLNSLMPPKDRQRNAPDSERFRQIQGSAERAPSTLNEEDRSVEVVMATEDVVSMGWYDEVLLMSGATGPEQIPLLDSHNRRSVSDQFGSVREITKNSQMIGRAYYASDPASDAAFIKMKEGHATDYSIGYRILKEVRIDAGQTAIVEGRSFTASPDTTLYIVTEWEYRELSQTPIGADGKSKARSENSQTSTKQKENPKMHPKVRAYLETIGLRSDATEEEANTFLADLPESTRALAEAKATESDDSEEGRGDTGEGTEGTRQAPEAAPASQTAPAAPADNGAQRVANILAAGRNLGMGEEAVQLVTANHDISEADAFRQLAEKQNQRSQSIQRPGIVVIADAGDKFRNAGIDAIMLRSDIQYTPEKLAPGAMELRSFSLTEMARECLRVNNLSLSGNSMEMIGRAMTTDDFSYILANVANKALNVGWDTAEETWDTCFATGFANDFKIHSLPRMSEFDDLDEVPEGREYKYGSFQDDQEQYQLATYGKLFMITRQTVINDDLDALTAVPMAMGESSSRKVGDIAWNVFIANANMGDGNALFSAAHNNLAAAGADLSITTLGAAETAMGLQKDQRELRRLNIRANYFIAPLTIKTSSEVFFQSQMIGTQANPNQNNIYSGNYFTRVYEPRLDDDSTTAWYLAAQKGKTVKVFFLNGADRPYMEEKQGFNVDGAEFKVRIDATAKAVDWRGVYKNPGE